MLEQKSMDEKEDHVYRNYSCNLIEKLDMKIFDHFCEIRDSDIESYLAGNYVNGRDKILSNSSLEERKFFLALYKDQGDVSSSKLAKLLFMESEYYPR